MKEIKRKHYTLLLSKNPCEIFDYYNVEEMHGLSNKECNLHSNTEDDAYIAGWTNYIPKKNKNYKYGDPFFVFINLTRCKTELDTILNINHEMMHAALMMYDWNINGKEEEIISWAENETRDLYKIVRVIKRK